MPAKAFLLLRYPNVISLSHSLQKHKPCRKPELGLNYMTKLEIRIVAYLPIKNAIAWY